MSGDATDQPSNSTSNPPFTYEWIDQRGPGNLGAPSDALKSSFTFSHGLAEQDGSAAVEKSFSNAITSTSPVATSFTPTGFLDASSLSANGIAALKPLNGEPGIAPPFSQSQPRHGDIQQRASPRGFDDVPPHPAQQPFSSVPPRTTTTAASPVYSAPDTPASTLTTVANGTYRQDASSKGPAVINKPVLKMKRTGQNFPLNSFTGSYRQKTGSYSPSQRQGSSPGSATRKAPDIVTKSGQEQLVETAEPKSLGVRPSEKLAAPLEVAPQPGLRFSGNAGPIDLLPHSSRVSANGDRGSKTATTVNSDTDDIIYEAAAQTGVLDGAVEDVIDNDSSSDDSDSQSDDEDETMDIDAGEPSFRQLFRAPDQGDDYAESQDDSEEEEEEEEEDDDATSASSSDESSITNEPPVALPSANIQHQEAYPSTILEMAEPGRLYCECRDKGITIRAGPAFFPVGYRKCTIYEGFPWVCAVRSCRLLYKTPAGLANHARFTHKKAMFNDNMDGTLSLVGSYAKKNQSGHSPPVVVSKRPLDPNEPAMREPTIPANKGLFKKVRSDVKKVSISPVFDGIDVVVSDADAHSLEPQKLPPPPPADPKSSQQMWEYIRPFLSNHNSLPSTNWARHIIHLPRVRDIKWNEERIKEHPFKDSHTRDITAFIVQVTGVESPTPCGNCVQGRGPFLGCITISPEAPDEAKRSVLSCANCYYHSCQSFCSLCQNMVGRKARRFRAGQMPDSYNVKRLSDVAHRKSSEAMKNRPQVLSASTTSLETVTWPGMKLYLPSEFKAIEKASSDRTYKVIKGLNGKDVLMCGALIPEKYDLDPTVPSYPWICPVRSCRRVFKKIASLGSHFVKAHPGALLNDNQDGTLSQIGYYNMPLPGNNGCPSLVISKNPLNPSEPPMEPPGLPGYVALAPKASKHKIGIKKRPETTRTQSGPLLTGSSKELWDYMRPYLPKSITSISSDSAALSLFDLPRKREVQWRMDLQNFQLDDDKRQILGLLVYLTGEKHKNGEKSCTHCVRHNGPFPGCLTLTKGIPKAGQPLVRSCANCIFTHLTASCSIKSQGNKDTGGQSQAGATAKKRVWVTDDESEAPLAARRRFDRLGPLDEEDRMEQRQKAVALSRKNEGQSLSSGEAVRVPVQTRAVNNGAAIKAESSSALIHSGQVQPDDLLEMEDWEIAPGRIRGTGAGGFNNNIAFSKSYLEANQAVRVSRDVTFEVKTIKAGNNLELEADQTKTRYCTLASGKLYVSVQEQDPFTIGPHGLFKIAPGSAAKIQNRLYIDSVLHISTFADG